MTAHLILGDCRESLTRFPENLIDACVTDPPYHLTSIVKRFGKPGSAPAKDRDGVFQRASGGFMGQTWDGGDVAMRPETWEAVLRVLKPGAHLVAFGGTRTFHRVACAIEDAGFEIRDTIMWVYGSGFPKSQNVSKAIDKAAGAEREVVGLRTDGRGASPQKLENHGPGDTGIGHMDGSRQSYLETAPATDAAKQWEGWGTALKPAWEPIILARKPLIGTVAANVQQHGTGALNIDDCRVPAEGGSPSAQMRARARETGKTPGRPGEYRETLEDRTSPERYMEERPGEALGRWPANLIHDGSEEVLEAFPANVKGAVSNGKLKGSGYGEGYGEMRQVAGYADAGSAARFFYCAKASKADREEGNKHPTVKPTALMRYLCKLVTPPKGIVLDPFMGSGSTGKAAILEGYQFIGMEMNEPYIEIARRRVGGEVKVHRPAKAA